MNSPTVHVPVLVDPVLEGLGLEAPLRPGARAGAPRVLVDGTLGGAGHARRMASCLQPDETLIAFDRDPSVIDRILPALEAELGVPAQRTGVGWSLRSQHHCRWILCADSYCALPRVLAEVGLAGVNGILLDLGLSSDQLQDAERGFSFRMDSPLDLRFNPESGLSAADFLRFKGEKEIADAIYLYGEERFSRRIARAIVERRRTEPIETSKQLADLIHRAVPGRIHGRVDSATRTFQALRIAVNRELEHVEEAMKTLPQCLAVGGRLVVISFHSLEDRIVKHAMREHALLRVVTKKPIVASPAEVDANPRSRSAKLRIAERIETGGD
ncbi:MAG: 16S rRNA (cytosine(1402)-N(4))-methyltransferase RsmH [Planctomycetota bacterium]